MRRQPGKTEKKGKKKGGKASTIVLIVVFLVGLCVLAYPKVADFWNSFHSSRAIISYSESIADMKNEEYERMLADAADYNARLNKRANPYVLPRELEEEYNSLLNVSGTGIMGYIEIPLINASLPLYHGVEENVLQVAVGHLEWTSLPVGGAGSHAVFSGHRGLPSAELFSKLDRLYNGDRFMLYILNEVYTYEVDQILIVLPEDVKSLTVTPGEDLCTLVTCTPYGINTHRLLVRGHRVENDRVSTVRVTAEAIQIEPVVVAAVLAIPLVIALFAVMIVNDRKQWAEKQEMDKNDEDAEL